MSVDKFKPTTVAGVTNVDGAPVERMDSLDRQKLDPRTKLHLLCEETRVVIGRDPRGGGVAFVARPRVMLQVLLDMKAQNALELIRLQRPVVLGSDDEGAIVGWFEDVALIVRSNVRDDNVYALGVDKIPESKMVDRRRAAELRMHARAGSLERLLEV